MRLHYLSFIFSILIIFGCQPKEQHKALGTLERDRITLSATSSEIIRALPKNEGSKVKTGDVLVELDSKKQKAILAHTIAEQAKAKAYLLRLTNGERPEDISAAKANVEMAQAKLTEAEKNFIRCAELVKKNLASVAQKDQALAARDTARAELKAAKESFAKLTAGSRPEDISQAQATLAATNADVELQTQLLNDLTITATRDGILDSLPYNLGERVNTGSIVAVIIADSAPFARVYVPSTDRINFNRGSEVQVHVDGLNEALKGTIRWIASEPSFTPYYALTEDERARLMYLAEITLPETTASLPSGIPAQMDLGDTANE